MNQKINLNVNGLVIESENDKLLIEACEDSGIHIPRFCWHKRLDPVGMCRMCLVEIDTPKGKILVPSCTTKVTDEMIVDTESDTVRKAQEGILEFLLINHPLDCPICDKAGECPLQDQTMAYGPGESRFVEEKRHFEKPLPISEIILLDRERCILCARCTRFSDEISGDPLIEFIQRGNKTEVNTFPNEPFKSYFSGNTVQICPVGALTSTSYRFKARPWDLKTTQSTCNGCSIGCTIELNSSQNKMLRILGVDNDAVNQGWLCDKGRYNFEYLNSKQRLLSSMKKVNDIFEEISLQEVFSDLKNEIIDESTKVKFFIGTNLTNEDYYTIKEFSKNIPAQNQTFYLNDDFLHSGKYQNTIDQASLNDLDNSDVIVLWAQDLKENLPILFLRIRKAVKNGVKLVIFGHSNQTLLDISDTFFGENIVSNNFEIIKDLNKIKDFKKSVSGKKVTAVIGKSSPFQSNESLDNLVKFLQENSEVKILRAYSKGNIFGAISVFDSVKGTKEFINDTSNDTPDLLFVVGADPVGSSIFSSNFKENIKKIKKVVSLDLFQHETSELSTYIIPTASTLGEKEGTFTNIEFRTSRIDKLVPSPGQSISDWEFFAGLINYCNLQEFSNSVHEINKKLYENLKSSNIPIFDNLDKPSNAEGIIHIKTPNVEISDEVIESNYFLGNKLYGDNATVRHSESISFLGSKKFIEMNEETANQYSLTNGICKLEQNSFSVNLTYNINNKLPDGLIFIPKNRRDLNKFNFLDEIKIFPGSQEGSLNVS